MQYYAGYRNGYYFMYPTTSLYSLFTEFTMTDKECQGVGNVVRVFDPRCRPWYKQAMDSPQDTILTSPYLSASPIVMMNSLIAKIYNPLKNWVEGAVAIDFNMKAFKIINETDLKMAGTDGGSGGA